MKRPWLGILGFLGLVGCADNVPVPDEFDAAFATGQVCVPSNVATGGANTHYPVRFVYHLYDCVNITPGTQFIRTIYQGGAPVGTMVMLATAHLTKNTAVEQASGCDARDLESPPAGRFTTVTQDFTVSLPKFGETPATGPFVVAIPYLTFDQGQELADRIKAGEDPVTVVGDIVGQQNIPSRQFQVTFSTDATPVPDAASIAASDCHDIPLP